MRTAIGVALALLFLAALVFATLRETSASCEVCVEFEGRSVCRRASAAQPAEAIQMAQSARSSRAASPRAWPVSARPAHGAV
jgi:hypothetical protein